MEKMERGAVLKGPYRYRLWRIWDRNKDLILYIGINPSTADGEKDDPTIRKLIRLTEKLGYGGFYIVNLFGYISSEPRDLYLVNNPIGKENDDHVIELINSCNRVVCIWGSAVNEHGKIRARMTLVKRYIVKKGKALYCFAVNKDGQPKHPLYLKEEGVELQAFEIG